MSDRSQTKNENPSSPTPHTLPPIFRLDSMSCRAQRKNENPFPLTRRLLTSIFKLTGTF